MPGETDNQMLCSEFDRLLTEALDGTLSGEKQARFHAHAGVCRVCGPLFAEIEAGRRLLHSLEQAAPPADLVNNILAATSGLSAARRQVPGRAALAPPAFVDRVQPWVAALTAPLVALVRQPRFAMSFGMAFFSLSMALNLAGVRLSDVRHLDLRPSAMVRQYHMTAGRVVKYYENIRFVYEFESRVRDLKRATTPAEPAPPQEQHRKDNNTSQQPEQRQERNYRRGDDQPILASTPDAPPVAVADATRRLA